MGIANVVVLVQFISFSAVRPAHQKYSSPHVDPSSMQLGTEVGSWRVRLLLTRKFRNSITLHRIGIAAVHLYFSARTLDILRFL